MSSRITCLAGLLAGMLAMAGVAAAGEARPVVVELFTSQGCYSCPPADELLGELIRERADVVALEFHVDYWNDLVWGSAGNWEDPFSSAEYTARQRAYAAAALKGRRGVYTPQMVIGGVFAAVGSHAGTVRRGIRHLQREAAPLTVDARRDGEALEITVAGNARAGASVWLARYDLEHTTEVRAGENNGKTMTNFNVVRSLQEVGAWRNEPLRLRVDNLALADNQGCAVFVQHRRLGEILGAGTCR